MSTDDLFTTAAADIVRRPLAARMRPTSLDEVVGQSRLKVVGSPFRQLVDHTDAQSPGESMAPASVILWGPPGCGKTTLAGLIAHQPGRRFVELSAVSSGVKEVRAVIDEARRSLGATGVETVLFIDEVHRFSKTQQDALLPAVEERWVTLVAATTENPTFSVVTPLLSRSLVVPLEALADSDITLVLQRAVTDQRGLDGAIELDEGVLELLVRRSAGDARRALTTLESAAGAARQRNALVIERGDVEKACGQSLAHYDRDGDYHYDIISAFIKSVRGSDVDASLHWLARMIDAGEDPRFIARRLIILAAEDIGLADRTALTTAVAAAEAVALIGMPEGRLPLAEATVALALAPKSNALIAAMDSALADVREGRGGPVPTHLRDGHSSSRIATDGDATYVYPHDEPGRIAAQQYLPDSLVGTRYFEPRQVGDEIALGERLERILRGLRGGEPQAD